MSEQTIRLDVYDYEERFDLADINHWMISRSHSKIDPIEIPNVGFVVYQNETPICAGFLRQCEGQVAMIDSLITNPDAPGPVRHCAIDLAIQHLIDAALDLDIHRIIAFSIDNGTLERSIKHGFHAVDHKLIVREL